ncbi:Protein of unknown function [Gryllus bimaculatus]|nr:Protein of unknown function [Gryllus bimaculatus]
MSSTQDCMDLQGRFAGSNERRRQASRRLVTGGTAAAAAEVAEAEMAAAPWTRDSHRPGDVYRRRGATKRQFISATLLRAV